VLVRGPFIDDELSVIETDFHAEVASTLRTSQMFAMFARSDNDSAQPSTQ